MTANHLHTRYTRFTEDSDAARMAGCLILSRLIEVPGAIAKLAQEQGDNESPYYKKAKAGREWRDLRSVAVDSLPRLTWTHYWRMSILRERFEFSPQDAIEYLKSCTKEANGNRIGSKKMQEMIEDEQRATVARMQTKMNTILFMLEKAKSAFQEGNMAYAKAIVESAIRKIGE